MLVVHRLHFGGAPSSGHWWIGTLLNLTPLETLTQWDWSVPDGGVTTVRIFKPTCCAWRVYVDPISRYVIFQGNALWMLDGIKRCFEAIYLVLCFTMFHSTWFYIHKLIFLVVRSREVKLTYFYPFAHGSPLWVSRQGAHLHSEQEDGATNSFGNLAQHFAASSFRLMRGVLMPTTVGRKGFVDQWIWYDMIIWQYDGSTLGSAAGSWGVMKCPGPAQCPSLQGCG